MQIFVDDVLGIRQSCLVGTAACAAIGHHLALDDYLQTALDADITPAELHEVLLITHLFAGFPAAIEGMIIFRKVLGQRGLSFSPDGDRMVQNLDYAQRGHSLLEQVYGGEKARLQKFLELLSPTLYDWIVVDGYGKVFARNLLPIFEKELCAVAVLALLRWPRQFAAHIRGALRNGVNRVAIEATIRLICTVDASLEEKNLLQTVENAVSRVLGKN